MLHGVAEDSLSLCFQAYNVRVYRHAFRVLPLAVALPPLSFPPPQQHPGQGPLSTGPLPAPSPPQITPNGAPLTSPTSQRRLQTAHTLWSPDTTAGCRWRRSRVRDLHTPLGIPSTSPGTCRPKTMHSCKSLAMSIINQCLDSHRALRRGLQCSIS